MAGRTNYRIKVNLSKFHQDARRFSWVYVNCTNVWLISHLKNHIRDVFNINEPFHLLLNGNEYLPPSEDVRVLNENEIIVVEPGSGINDVGDRVPAASLPERENTFVREASTVVDAASNQPSETEPENAPEISRIENENFNNASRTNATLYHSMLDATEMDITVKSPTKDDSMDLNSSAMESYAESAPSSHKRKRIRRKKGSKQESSICEIIENERKKSFDKPRVVDSCILPSGKHIRFDNVDVEINDSGAGNGEIQMTVGNSNGNLNTQPSSTHLKNLRHQNLSSLLSLRNCSSPMTFVSKKPKYGPTEESNGQMETEAAAQPSNPVKDTTLSQISTSNSANNLTQSNDQNDDNYSNVKPQDYPALQTKIEIHDVVAFKVLRMGSEYTPEVSNYIVAKTLSWCPKKQLYTFEILHGRSEVDGPLGKFSLPDDETEPKKSNNTVEYNFVQLIDPRLIARK